MLKVVIFVVGLLCSFYVTGIQAYSVSGNKILDLNGNQITLRGIVRPSLEWNPDGQYLAYSDYALMAGSGWGANIIRLPLNQAYWLPGSIYYNSNYQSTVAQQVAWIKDLGMGVILDLHWSTGAGTDPGQQCMADSSSITFWIAVATQFKNDPNIIFELYNEPHDVSWDVWRNGGAACGFNVAGMQQLYNAVRVNASANNVVIINGLNYGFDLSGVAQNPITGTNIVYGTHVYDQSGQQPSDWGAGFGYLAPTYPVIATEFGQYCNNDDFVQQFITYAQTNGIHWTAWAWWVQDCTFPSLIADWSGDPLAPAGTLVQAALQEYAAGSSVGLTTTLSFVVNFYSILSLNYVQIKQPITGTLYTTQSVQILIDGTWQNFSNILNLLSYQFESNSPFSPPLSIRILTTNGYVAELDNVITSLSSGVTYTITATYKPQ